MTTTRDPHDTPPAQPGATSQNDVTGHAPEKDDSPLESIGKAVTDPVTTAADDEEPRTDGVPPVKPGN